MFCDKCGKENPNGAAFCADCGNTLNTAEVTEEAIAEQVPKTNGSNTELFARIIKIAIPAVIAVILVCILFSCIGGGGYKGVFKDYFNASVKGSGNAKKLLNATIDPYLLDYYIDETERYDDKKDALEELEEDIEDIRDEIKDMEDEYEGKFKVSYKIDKVKKYDKDEVKAFAEYLDEEYGYKKKDVKDLVLLDVEVEAKIGDEKFDNDREFAMIKVKGKWYVFPLIYSKSQLKEIIRAYK